MYVVSSPLFSRFRTPHSLGCVGFSIHGLTPNFINDISIVIYFNNTLFRSYNSIGTLSNSLLKYGNHLSISKLL